MVPLDAESLRRLRRIVKDVHAARAGVPVGRLVELVEGVAIDGGLTIDFEASRQLGEPMVVLRVPPRPAECLASLTPREREVARLVADGLVNKQIATRLGVSLPTVKDHVHRILEKTGLPNRAAVAAALAGRSPSRRAP